MKILSYIYSLPTKGNLAWEYHPFHNYQTDVDLYKWNNFLIPEGCAVDIKTGEILYSINGVWTNKRGEKIEDENIKKASDVSESIYARAGSLIDLETDKLDFDLEHPVSMEILPSYDGSVNIILNDDKNIPRLINSRFSVREKNTYEIVDRIGENDTNIYNSDNFDKDSSLYFQYESNPVVEYNSLIKGDLPVGQYCFYLTYCDSDDNESDYIAESGLIPVFLGTERDPNSMNGGIKNLNSYKGIRLKISNLDNSYNYLKIYYVRYFADYQQNRVLECKKILRKYLISKSTQFIQITGLEQCEDIDANILNLTRFNPKHILTQALCKNMLFFGNIVKNTDDYRELSDIALRIIPQISIDSCPQPDVDYLENSGYYSVNNIYNKTGYFNEEYYRFGVVFIYNNGTLSNVYNTLGLELTGDNVAAKGLFSKENEVTRQYIKVDDFGWISNNDDFDLISNDDDKNIKYLNAKGVCYINYQDTQEQDNQEQDNQEQNIQKQDDIIGITFNIPKQVQLYLKLNLGIRGLFFVRQKCVPNLIAQCYLLPMDEVLEAPIIEYKEGDLTKRITECFVTQTTSWTKDNPKGYNRKVPTNGRTLTEFYKPRIYTNTETPSSVAYAAICPDFLLNQPYYNQIFNGSKFKLKKVAEAYLTNDINNPRFYQTKGYNYDVKDSNLSSVIINSVTENVPTVAIKDKIYRTEIGVAEEAFRFRYVGIDSGTYNAGEKVGKKDSVTNLVNEATNIVRGIYSPYLAIYSESGKLDTSCLYNIYKNEYYNTNYKQEYQTRMDSYEPFYAISDRYNFNLIEEDKLTCFRGDCYLNTFTYRFNRNFNDPSLANNDKIIEIDTWKNSYDVAKPTKWENINRGDVNAVPLGSWITFKVRSAMNYALRSEDHSFTSEKALMGAPRSFYPKSHLLQKGENKIPDSYLYNDAFRATLGFKSYFTLENINYLKDTFSNRILYSAISIQDSYKNNYRYSLSTYFRDYSTEYGSITKLVAFEGYLLVIFEHGIGLAVINERVLAGNTEGEPIFINTKNVLPEELTIISDNYGTQWSESVVKSESGYVYGVDTVAKKIWRVKGQNIEILSDLKLNKFLVDNITLTERELQPYIGLKNVKTHYNNNKKDILFTFYDDVYKDEEKVWNLCFNELVDEFITFYSWVPSYSANIDNIFFSFDRDTSKQLALLRNSNSNIPENTGVLVKNPIVNNFDNDGYAEIELTYVHPIFKQIPSKNLEFEILKDHWGNCEKAEIKTEIKIEPGTKTVTKINKLRISSDIFSKNSVALLYIKPKLVSSDKNPYQNETLVELDFKSETIAIACDYIFNLNNDEKFLRNDFYVHGRAGIFDLKDDILPCYWYGKQHPFEFEFIVNGNLGILKIFNNLKIISNKVEPESFHFEIEGDNYGFSEDKLNMYYRQEATKQQYLNLGSDILFDRNFSELKNQLNLNPKSTIFPMYYNRIDTFNDIYDKYQLMTCDDVDYLNLSGSEIVWNKDLKQFNIITHIKNSPINKVGRLRGNSHYKESIWDVQIPSLIFNLKEEFKWINNKPTLVLSNIPDDIKTLMLTGDRLPNTYTNLGQISLDEWTFRKESKLRDKWIKIRVRYKGNELAIIHSLITLYNFSYG